MFVTGSDTRATISYWYWSDKDTILLFIFDIIKGFIIKCIRDMLNKILYLLHIVTEYYNKVFLLLNLFQILFKTLVLWGQWMDELFIFAAFLHGDAAAAAAAQMAPEECCSGTFWWWGVHRVTTENASVLTVGGSLNCQLLMTPRHWPEKVKGKGTWWESQRSRVPLGTCWTTVKKVGRFMPGLVTVCRPGLSARSRVAAASYSPFTIRYIDDIIIISSS